MQAPIYGYSPAPTYGPSPAPQYGYTPAPPPYGAPPAPYGSPAPHYAPAPHHPPVPHHPPPHHEEGPPACSANTTKPWCLEDSEYPAYEISHAVEYNYAGVAALYKDVLANTENSVDRLVDEDVAALVCDNGSGMCKAGFAG